MSSLSSFLCVFLYGEKGWQQWQPKIKKKVREVREVAAAGDYPAKKHKSQVKSKVDEKSARVWWRCETIPVEDDDEHADDMMTLCCGFSHFFLPAHKLNKKSGRIKPKLSWRRRRWL